MPDLPPADPKPPRISLVSLLLAGVFLVAILAAGLCTQSWVKRLDQPPAGTYRIAANEKGTFFLKLTQKSIKGLHRTNGIRGHLEVPGEAKPRPLAVQDTTSTEWQKKIKIPQFFSAAPSVANIESNIVLLLETQIPSDSTLIGRTLPLTFDIDMTIPRVDPQNLKAGLEAPLKDSWTVPVQIMPPGYTRIYQRAGHISLIVAGVAFVLLFFRLSIRKKASAVTPPVAGA